LSVSPFDSTVLQGGTQDNGTWRNNGRVATWFNSMIGDGGQSGFDASKRRFRFHTFFDASVDVNFDSGELSKWIWTGDPIYGQPNTQFYVPAISDPVTSGTMFVGTGSSVYRTRTYGLGRRTVAQAQRICNEWTGSFTRRCGDWKPTGLIPLTSDTYGDRAGGAVSAVERTSADTSTAWAATTTGRVFVTHNVDARHASEVSWQRLDDDVRNDPNRFVTSIAINPKDPDQVWISYSGFSATTPGTAGHIFRVSYNNRRATWTDASADLADLPVNDLVRDDATGDLYAATDFGVLRRVRGDDSWTVAAPGLPKVEVAGLTIVSDDRVLYAASHGLSAFRLRLGSR
ncbi:MAG: exo-alpha-sialidase, partial [Propionibacteriales bacterium]|nr:exo-alpha-sialidase [Propionibacteriales bacterium]